MYNSQHMVNMSAKQKAPESPLTLSKKEVLTVSEKVNAIKAVENGHSH